MHSASPSRQYSLHIDISKNGIAQYDLTWPLRLAGKTLTVTWNMSGDVGLMVLFLQHWHANNIDLHIQNPIVQALYDVTHSFVVAVTYQIPLCKELHWVSSNSHPPASCPSNWSSRLNLKVNGTMGLDWLHLIISQYNYKHRNWFSQDSKWHSQLILYTVHDMNVYPYHNLRALQRNMIMLPLIPC